MAPECTAGALPPRAGALLAVCIALPVPAVLWTRIRRSNLIRAAGNLASAFQAKATTGTTHAQLITVPGRLARSARRLSLHLPTGWPWLNQWEQLATAANSPPLAA